MLLDRKSTNVSHPVSRAELHSSLRTFAGYLEDLERIGFDAAATKLRLVVNYARRERGTHALWELLVAHLPNADFLSAVRDELRPPSDPRGALAHVHQLLVHIKQGHKLNLREILTRSELSPGGGGLDQRWGRFVDMVIKPYRARVEEILTWLAARDADERVEAGAELARALSELLGDAKSSPVDAVRASEAKVSNPDDSEPSDSSANAALDLRLLELELRKHQPDPARLAELRRDLGPAGLAERVPSASAASRPPRGDAAALEEAWIELEAARAALAAERAAFELEKQTFREGSGRS
jgi:hypothetical protein